MNPYKKIEMEIEKIVGGNSNLLFVKGPAGTGKTHTIRQYLNRYKADYFIINGDLTDAYLYRVLYENSHKVIWFQDVARILTSLKAINILKAITETTGKREVSLYNYSHHMVDLPHSFEFTGSIIFDYNEVPRRFKADFDALISRGGFVEMNLTEYQIKKVMLQIAHGNPEKEMVTAFIVDKYVFNGRNRLNLRVQQTAFKTYEFCKQRKYDWQTMILEDINDDITEIRKLLSSLIGNKIIQKTELKKLLINSNICSSVRTAERKIKDYIELGELIEKEDRQRNRYVCLGGTETK